MKALVRYKYGTPDDLWLEEIPKPSARDDELLIRIHAVSLNLGDWELLTGVPLFIKVIATLAAGSPSNDPGKPSRGFFGPRHKILGTDLAGRVEAVGKRVTRYKPGDEVFGMSIFGALAEYVCVPEKADLAQKPPEMSFEEAAAIPQAAFIALEAFRDREQAQPGKKVLINGAGGGAGSLAVQLAKMHGTEVTAVDNGLKLEMMRSIGADHVIDYTREDFRKSGERYDLILDMAAHRSIFASTRTLTPDGIYFLAGGGFYPTLQAGLLGPLLSRLGRKKIVFLLAGTPREDLDRMSELYKTGTVVPIIDKTFPLMNGAEAFRMVGEGRALGKVVCVP